MFFLIVQYILCRCYERVPLCHCNPNHSDRTPDTADIKKDTDKLDKKERDKG